MNNTKLFFIACLSLLLAIPVLSAEQIQKTNSCFSGPFASHQSWVELLSEKKKGFNKEAFLQHFPNEKFAQRQGALDCVDFSYQVDGLNIEGYYLAPKEGKALPVIIFNRGGNGAYGYVNFGTKMDLLSDLALDGYLVIGSQYRGASKKITNNGADEFGGADVNDVVALLAVLKEIPQADTSKVALMGWSRGVMQAYIASQRMPEIKTIVAVAGVSDAEKALVWRPAMEKVYQARIANFAENRQAELEKRSVSKWLDKLPAKAPILLVHGDKDNKVNVEQSINLNEQLNAINHPHKLLIYKDDGHNLRVHKAELLLELHTWFATYLK